MKIKPLYKDDNNVLVGLESDFPEVCVIDGLVVEIDLQSKRILNHPWSGQKKLKHRTYSPIRKEEKAEYRKRVERSLKRKGIKQVLEMLMNPTTDQVQSLIWIPDRLSE